MSESHDPCPPAPTPASAPQLDRLAFTSAFSSQIDVATTEMWRPAEGIGHVPYIEVARCWLAAGTPLAPPAVQADLVRGFVAAARARGRVAAFFGLPEGLAEAGGLRWVACGQEPLWVASRWADPVARLRCFRQTRRAVRAGVEVAPLPPPSEAALLPSVAAQLDALLASWQAGQNLPPLQFLAKASLRHEVPNALRWVAWWRGRPVGAAVALPPGGRGPWLIEQLIRAPQAPNGTVELLVDQAMRSIGRRDAKAIVSLGVVALAGEVPLVLRLARWLGRDLYPFAGLAAFRRKLGPETVARLGLAYPPGQSAVRTVASLLLAFAGGRPLRFTWDLVRQGSTPLVWAIAGCLVPWTACLAVTPVHWFASAAVQRAWVAFDAVLAACLLRLASRPDVRLARALAVVVTGDAVLTALEGGFAPGPQGPAWVHVALRALAVAAPALAARVLWGLDARLRRRAAGQPFAQKATSAPCTPPRPSACATRRRSFWPWWPRA